MGLGREGGAHSVVHRNIDNFRDGRRDVKRFLMRRNKKIPEPASRAPTH